MEVSKTNNEQFFHRNELADPLGGNPKPKYRRLWARGRPAYKGERVWRIAKKDGVEAMIGRLTANHSKDVFPTRRSNAKLGIPSATLKRYKAHSSLFYQTFL